MLDDVLAPDLRLVVCGSAAGRRSAELGQYYAGRGNQFWATLAATGLTPRLLSPSEARLLPSFGIGLTDVVKGQSGGDADLDFSRASPDAVRDKILQFQPKYLCFNGKRAARVFLGRREIEFEVQPELVGATALFVAPSTSGAARGFWDQQVWHKLAGLVEAAA